MKDELLSDLSDLLGLYHLKKSAIQDGSCSCRVLKAIPSSCSPYVS